MEYNIEQLRDELKEYYGTAVYIYRGGDSKEHPFGLAELVAIDELNDEEILTVANENGMI